MKKEVMIKIKGVNQVEGQEDIIEMVTTGVFSRQNGKYYISYEESEATGFEGSKTTLKVEKGRVTMLRMGDAPSQLIVEDGIRHQCSYNTGYGPLMLGISGKGIRSTLTDQGGDVEFTYSVDINTSLASENKIFVSVLDC